MNIWAAVMLLASGLFAGGATSFTWSRVPAWREMPPPQFLADFAQTIRRTDRVQPALLLTAIVSTSVFGFTAGSTAGVLALFGAGGLLAILIASVGVLVPLQRRILATQPSQFETLGEMQRRWFRGHLGRSALSVASFTIVAVAASM
jgi:hypothetical protein